MTPNHVPSPRQGALALLAALALLQGPALAQQKSGARGPRATQGAAPANRPAPMPPNTPQAATVAADANTATASPIRYPETRRDGTVEVIHGQRIEDPYRWLEDDNSAETAEWVRRQNELTFSYLERIPTRAAIGERLRQLFNFERFSLPSLIGPRRLYQKNDGLQNQSVYYLQNTPTAEPRVFIDPNRIDAQGTTTYSYLNDAPGGKLASFAVQRAGSDWNDIIIYDLETGTPRPDTLKWVKFSATAWDGDQGFYYARYPAPAKGQALTKVNAAQQVYYHRLGDPQEKDRLIFEDPANPLRYFGPDVTEDRQYFVLTIAQGTSGKELRVRPLKDAKAPLRPITPSMESDYDVVDTDGPRLLVYTNYQAPRYRVVSIDPNNPDPKNWRTVVPQGEALLKSVNAAGGRLILTYLKDVTSRMQIVDRQGKAQGGEIALPGLGTVGGVTSKRDQNVAYYSFSSFTQPTTIYELDVTTGQSRVYRQATPKTDLSRFTTDQEFFVSKDGTRVPMFIIRDKDAPRDGRRPTLVYGYGGFNISLTPSYNPSFIPLLESGGVVAIVNLRGGGEFGQDWHKAGMLLNKQNVFDDFIGAAEHLIKMQYTSPSHLAIEGGSNGGLLVGAVMTQRPELYRVAFPRVGVLDMLRYHKFTVGWGWMVEYGSPDSARHFANLRKYSPLHNLRPGTAYPSTMVMTADHDDRVVPAHSFKYAAALQAAQAGPNPCLIRVDVSAGHGAGKPISKALEERADMIAFMLHEIGAEYRHVR